jgi:pyruvate kinase
MAKRSPLNRLEKLAAQLRQLDEEMLRLEAANETGQLPKEHANGARNLLHYVALRRHDIRGLQQELAAIGLSSLGRTESHVRASIGAVLRVLTHLSRSGSRALGSGRIEPGVTEGRRQLARNTANLLGPAPAGRRVRIMVTMPPEAATDYSLVRDLLAGGMNCMRINCAHDTPEAWAAMIGQLRAAEAETGLRCMVEMDVAGPKLRTGPIEPGPSVVKVKPERDCFGRVTSPAQIWLTPSKSPEPPPPGIDVRVPMPAAWLAKLKRGTEIRFTDTRGAKRKMTAIEKLGRSWRAGAGQSAYITPGLPMRAMLGGDSVTAHCGPMPAAPKSLRLLEGQTLILTRDLTPGRGAIYNGSGEILEPARVGVTLPEFFDCVKPGEPIWFDDGKIGGVISAVADGEVQVRITQARPGGEKLGAEKGINIPETDLRIPALTEEDHKNLEFIAANADIVGFSFVGSAADVAQMRARLAELGREEMGIILKIETRRGFDNLPPILLEAMRGRAVGVMIARGDLAVECGFERLAEIQEEILWIAESAYVPVVWATQVLETLAKTGRPSRSEITDAAMGERAECVMLNKGPYVVEAVRALDDILRRMESHQEKKTACLRKLQVAASFGAAAG